jgi:hypothetical protein
MMPNPPGSPEDGEQLKRVQQLLSRLRCVACGRPYDPGQCTVVERREGAWILSAMCPRCRTAGYVLVIMDLRREPEPSAPDPDDRDRARALPAITADELIDLHFWLESYSGDLDSLVGP